jgi:hypothetical protein
VLAWWARWPDANIIVVTGEVSGVVAIDIDPAHGGAESCENFPIMVDALSVETPRSLTGGGGVHHLFKWPGHEVPNAAGVFPGVDFRGDHGYIVAPESHHISGGTYEWDVTAHPDDVPLAEMRPDFLAALASKTRYGSSAGATEAPEARGRLDIDGIIEGTVTVREGERNETMARVVGALAHIAGTDKGCLGLAMGVNERSFDPPLEESEVELIVISILRRERRKEKAEKAANDLMADERMAMPLNEMSPVDQLDQAEALWKGAGVPFITDWFVMLGGDGASYIITTPENEIGLGGDLLNYLEIRRRLLNAGVALLPDMRSGPCRGTRACGTCGNWPVRKSSRQRGPGSAWTSGWRCSPIRTRRWCRGRCPTDATGSRVRRSSLTMTSG